MSTTASDGELGASHARDSNLPERAVSPNLRIIRRPALSNPCWDVSDVSRMFACDEQPDISKTLSNSAPRSFGL